MKKMLLPSSTLVAIDIGTTKVCALVAQKITDSQFDVIGIGRAPSRGLAQGTVVDIAPAVQAIKAAVQEAEMMAGCTIESAYIGISGSHIGAHTSTGMVPIKNGTIRESDVTRVIAASQAIPLPEDEQILHVVAQAFTIDGKHAVRDPMSMHGVRLDAKVNIITGNTMLVKNLIQCCESASIKVRDVILEPIASAEAVLSPDERELGVALLDIGGGTSDFVIYHRDTIQHTKIVPIAGALFTNDIALCLRMTRDEAERIKKQYATLTTSYASEQQTIRSIDNENMRTIMLDDVTRILQARTEELFTIIKEEIAAHNLAPFMPAGIVLTGGGALLNGIAQQAEKILGVPARIGRPKMMTSFKEELQNPIYATAYGLILYAIRQEQKNQRASHGNGAGKIFWQVKDWIAEFF